MNFRVQHSFHAVLKGGGFMPQNMGSLQQTAHTALGKKSMSKSIFFPDFAMIQ